MRTIAVDNYKGDGIRGRQKIGKFECNPKE